MLIRRRCLAWAHGVGSAGLMGFGVRVLGQEVGLDTRTRRSAHVRQLRTTGGREHGSRHGVDVLTTDKRSVSGGRILSGPAAACAKGQWSANRD